VNGESSIPIGMRRFVRDPDCCIRDRFTFAGDESAANFDLLAHR